VRRFARLSVISVVLIQTGKFARGVHAMSDVSLEELLKLLENKFDVWDCGTTAKDVEEWFEDFEPKFEAFVAELRKLRNDMQQRLDYYKNKPYASCAQDELEKFIRQLDAQLGEAIK